MSDVLYVYIIFFSKIDILHPALLFFIMQLVFIAFHPFHSGLWGKIISLYIKYVMSYFMKVGPFLVIIVTYIRCHLLLDKVYCH